MKGAIYLRVMHVLFFLVMMRIFSRIGKQLQAMEDGSIGFEEAMCGILKFIQGER